MGDGGGAAFGAEGWMRAKPGMPCAVTDFRKKQRATGQRPVTVIGLSEFKAEIDAWAERQDDKLRRSIAISMGSKNRLHLQCTQLEVLLKERGEGEMMAESHYEELERRVTTAESEIEGEKLVSRYAMEQSTRSTEAFLALRSEVAALRADIAVVAARVDHLSGEAAVTRASLIRHGRALDVLQQDVGGLRNDMIAIRQDMATRQELAAVREELRSEMAAMREDARSGTSAMREELSSEIAAMREDARSGTSAMREELSSEMAAMREEAATRHAELLAAIRVVAGVVPPA